MGRAKTLSLQSDARNVKTFPVVRWGLWILYRTKTGIELQTWTSQYGLALRKKESSKPGGILCHKLASQIVEFRTRNEGWAFFTFRVA